MNIDIPILASVKDLQTQHGLTYENYQRYRSYCSRKLHRIRRSLNVHQGVQPSAKARHQRGRKLMDVSNVMVLDAGEKNPEYGERMLIIPLTLAERAWSFAMQLKQETTDQPRRRYHLIRRLKKASEHAKRFEKLCHDPESPCSSRTKGEATAYSSYITGMYNMEREIWADAKENLSRAYDFYFKASIWIRDDIVQEHYRQRIDELRASLRYCSFNLPDKEQPTANLPTTLNFHDIANKHAMKCLQETSPIKSAVKEESIKVETESESADRNVVRGERKKGGVVAEAKDKNKGKGKDTDEKDEELNKTEDQPADDDHNRDEEVADEEEYEEDDEDEDDDDEDEDKQQGPSGVTHLLKGWLGFSLSK